MFPVIWQLLIQLSKCLQLLHNSACTCRTPRVSVELHKVKREEKNTECFKTEHFKMNWVYYAVEVCWAFPAILTIYVDQNREELPFRLSSIGAHCISLKIRERIISHFAQICGNTGGVWIMMVSVAMHSGLLIQSLLFMKFSCLSKRVWHSSWVGSEWWKTTSAQTPLRPLWMRQAFSSRQTVQTQLTHAHPLWVRPGET